MSPFHFCIFSPARSLSVLYSFFSKNRKQQQKFVLREEVVSLTGLEHGTAGPGNDTHVHMYDNWPPLYNRNTDKNAVKPINMT